MCMQPVLLLSYSAMLNDEDHISNFFVNTSYFFCPFRIEFEYIICRDVDLYLHIVSYHM